MVGGEKNEIMGSHLPFTTTNSTEVLAYKAQLLKMKVTMQVFVILQLKHLMVFIFLTKCYYKPASI